MSAAEIIELIKRLPPKEKAEVIAFIQEEQGRTADPKAVSDAEFERAAERVFVENRDLLRRLAQ